MGHPQKSEVVRLNLAVIADRALGLILEKHAWELTLCSECGETEFVHERDCTLALEVEQKAELVVNNGLKLGPLITFNERH